MFDRLTEKLSDSFKKLTGKDKISEKVLDTLLRDVRAALLDADVNYDVTENFLKSIADKALDQKVERALNPNEALMNIIYQELLELLGKEAKEFDYPKSQKKRILFVGLQGTGKTTSAAKFAYLLKQKKGRKPLLVAADLARPAAIEQLEILGKQVGVDVIADKEAKDPVYLVREALKTASQQDYDTLIFDTAGRLSVDEALMDQLAQMNEVIQADEIFLTVDAMSGQDIIHTADIFNKRLGVTGLVVTKYDSDAKGGAILSVKSLTGVPVVLVGTGEKITDSDIFYPDRVASRIIGSGDLQTLIETAQDKLDADAGERSMRRMMEGKFTFDDMLDQFNQLNKMGSFSSLLKMIPGANQMAQQVNDDDTNKMIKKSKAIIQSMTPEEREDASLLRASRKNRIASGSGTSVQDVNRLINQYEKAKEQMRMLKRMAGKFPM